MDMHELGVMDGERVAPCVELSASCNSQESTRNYVKEGGQSRKASPCCELHLPSTSQKGVERAAREIAVLGDDVVDFEEQKLWQIQKEELEKELYHCTKAHKMSILQSAYEMSKLQVSFVLVKRQESLAKEQLEDALGVVKKLQAKVERLNGQVRHTETENRRLNTALSTLSSELDNRTAEKENLQRALEEAKKATTNNSIKSVDIVEMWTEETTPLIAQHELEIKQLQKIESNMAIGKGLVTDRNVLEKWTLESEALHSATIQLQELKRKLAVSERLESDLAASKLGLERVTTEKKELLIQLEATTKELLECKKKIADTELHDAELGRYAQVLNVEKITLMGQLELLRGELDKQKEAARIAQIEANKAMEAERECAKAKKLVEEKEEEMEYYIKQLESLREKNSMLRTQLDMEQQCKEAEMTAMPKLHEQSMNLLSRNLNTSMELVASNSVQNPQKIPPEPTTLDVSEAIPEAVEKKKSSKDNSRREPLQEISGKGKGRSTTEGLDKMPNPEPDAVEAPTSRPLKRSSRLRNRVSTQHSTDSASATTGGHKHVIDLVEDENDENDGVIEDVTQTNRRSVSRLKRPPALVPAETETGKKKGRKKYLNARSTDVELGPAHLLVGRSDRDERVKNLSSAAGMSDLRPTPLRSSATPRTVSRLPR
ncbi:hypothetical protein KC19_10G050600 [Ceratodon purpureus]|uniref:Uncharacterized protein n=1 Tax=Ceratodon purpureus TaxID=3225 RepID=A0A8T0GI91_CERPU|nr:hypothetical protein KC19_10G050600 [Ceratodon purpureus]